MRKAALAAHRARAAHAPHAVAGPHAALLLRAATGRAHYSSIGLWQWVHCCMLQASKLRHRNAALREPRAESIGTSESLHATVVLLAYFYYTSQDMDGSAEPSQSSVPRIKLMQL